MLLFRKKIDGWDSYVNETISGIFPYMAADANPDANLWLDVSSIENWDLYGKRVGKDYKWWRDKIKDLVQDLGGGNIDAGFALCTLPEKLILVKHKIGSHALNMDAYKTYYMSLGQDASTAYTNAFATVIQLGLVYQSVVTPIRNTRFAYAYGLIYNYLPLNAKQIFEIDPLGNPFADKVWTPTHKVVASYVSFGIEGTEINDPEGMSDWLFGENSFIGLGFKDYPWTPENGLSMAQLAAGAWDIIHNGNY